MVQSTFGWLASYPKSGNTWLRMMLGSLMSGGAAVNINQNDFGGGPASRAEVDELLGVESSELTAAELVAVQPALYGAIAADSSEALILRKVHDRFWCVPSGEAAFPASLSRCTIYLVRDPRDVAVSYAHHRGRSVDWAIAFMADTIASIANDEGSMKEQLPQPLGSWSDHVTSWHDQHQIGVLTIRYEDLLSAPVRHLRDAADCLGILSDTASVEAAVSATRFDVLRAQEQVDGFVERRPGSSAPFFREGRSGGWRERLTPAQADCMLSAHRDVMSRFGYV
jgi:aryl sulfotransferase